MSTNRRPSTTAKELDDPPEFDLSFLFDDVQNPSEVTIFPDTAPGETVSTTEWITAQTDSVLSVEDVR